MSDTDETARLIEQDRQRREREWWLLLLFLFDEGGIDDVASHIRHDGDVGRVLNNVLGKAVVPLSRVSAAAHIGGMRRFASLSGQTFTQPDAATKASIARLYEAGARLAADAITSTLRQALADVREKYPDEAASIVAQSAFDNAGMSSADKSSLKLGAERAIVSASNAGMLHGAISGERDVMIRHHTVEDGNETAICHDRANLTLPASHAYWRNGGVPQLHWGCRSILMPAPPGAEASEWLPSIPPMLGFGFNPLPAWAGVRAA